MARNYYIILGVDSDATQNQIRSAYRRKAKQLHPDRCEGNSSEPFRDVQEAYETLSDPGRRRTYDDELAHTTRPQASPSVARAEALRSRHCPVEPLIPTERAAGLGGTRLNRDFYPSIAETLSRVWSDLDSLGWPGAERGEELQVTVRLTRDQALHGGRVRVRVPIQATCPNCRGYGAVGLNECWACSGQGTVVEQRPVWISFPAGVSGSSVARLSLIRLGAPNAYLTVRFDVRGR